MELGPHCVHLGLFTADLSLPGCTSLKEKRRILRGLVDKLRSKGNLSVAEVGYVDAHARAVLAVAYVNASRAQAERVLHHVERIIESRDGLVVNASYLDWR